MPRVWGDDVGRLPVPMVANVNARRAAWRRYWRRNSPDWVWPVLEAHSAVDPCRGPGCGWHDDAVNLHARTRAGIAAALGKSERRVKAAMAWARDHGAVHVHAEGHRGHQQTVHYLTPGMPLDCGACLAQTPAEFVVDEAHEQEATGDPRW